MNFDARSISFDRLIGGAESGGDDTPHPRKRGPPLDDLKVNRADRFKPIDWNDIVFDPNKQWMIEGVLPLRGLALIYGKQASLKSFLATDLGRCVALGHSWAGIQVEKGCVAYIAAEGGHGIAKRLAPHKTKHAMPRGQFAVIPAAPNLGSREGDLPALVAAVEGAGLAPALIIIDTAAAAIGGADENNSGMASFIDNAQTLGQRFDCLVLIVHHVWHDDQKRPRGWSGLGPALDVQILCERPARDMRAVLTIQKQKEEADGICLEARLSRVVVTADEHGNETSATLVVDHVRKMDTAERPATEKRPARAVLSLALLDVYDRLAEAAPSIVGDTGAGVRKVKVEAVRDALKDRGLLDLDDASSCITATGRSQFLRAKIKLIGERKLFEARGLVWRPA